MPDRKVPDKSTGKTKADRSNIIDWRAKHKESMAKDGLIEESPKPQNEDWDAMRDPRSDDLIGAPGYGDGPGNLPGLLPPIFEAAIRAKCHLWGCDPTLMAVGFLAAHAGCISSHVRVQTNPFDPGVDINICDFSCFVGGSGVNKSGPVKDLTDYVKTRNRALTDEEIARLHDKPKEYARDLWMTTASFEMMVQQVATNLGLPLSVISPEFHTFLTECVKHHAQQGYEMISDVMNAAFDGEEYKKKLKDLRNMRAYATSLHVNLLTATTPGRLSKWAHFDKAIADGFFGRVSFGTATREHSWPIEPERAPAGAVDQWHSLLAFLMDLGDMLLVLHPDAHGPWLDYANAKKAQNLEWRGRRAEGFVAWNSKYEKRVMRLAAMFQFYKLHAGECSTRPGRELPPEATGDSRDSKMSGPRIQRVLDIDFDSLAAAVDFHEQFLLPQQVYFHDTAVMADENQQFGLDLFIRILAGNDEFFYRDDLVGSKGPTSLRGDGKDKDAARSRALTYAMNMGLLVPSPKARNYGKEPAPLCNRFDVPPMLRRKFATDIPWAQGEHARVRAAMAASIPALKLKRFEEIVRAPKNEASPSSPKSASSPDSPSSPDIEGLPE